MIAGVAVVVLGLIAVDHVGLLGATGNDWVQFDKKTFPVTHVISGDEIVINCGDQDVPVRLLGIDAPDPGVHGDAAALAYTQARATGKSVTLRLEPTQTRDEKRNVLAYVYLQDNDNLNLDAIRDGKAYADRRMKHTLASSFETAETEARKKSRGLWNGLRNEDMPAWRQQWLKDFFAARRATTRPAKP